MLKTYKFYNEKLKRLAIFASQVGEELNITIIPCSKNDQFSRKKAFILLNDKDSYKEKVTIPIVDNSPGKTFISWCRENYLYKTYFTINAQIPIIDKYSTIIDLRNKLNQHNTDEVVQNKD